MKKPVPMHKKTMSASTKARARPEKNEVVLLK